MPPKVEKKNGALIILDEDVSYKDAFLMSILPGWIVIFDMRPDGKESAKEIAIMKLTIIDERKIPTFPSKWELFNAFHYTKSADDVNVVILGMDPYDTPGYAMGLAFSMRRGIRISQSLRNIFSVLNDNNDCEFPKENNNGSLVSWATQGVLLINIALTIEAGAKSGAHIPLWTRFTELIIMSLSTYRTGLVFVFWGRDAREFEKYVKKPQTHKILKGAHPAARSGEFAAECKTHFTEINEHLVKQGKPAITWQT